MAILLLVAYTLLHTSWVQTRLVNFFTGRVERMTGVKIEIGGVDFRPIKSLVLTDMLLRDYRNDTLLYCKNLHVRIDSFRLTSRSFTVRDITLDRAYFNLWSVQGENRMVLNLDVFLDAFQQEENAKTAQAKESINWVVGLKRIGIRNSRFVYKEQDYEPLEYGINWTDVVCAGVNADITELDVSGNKFGARVTDLSLVEKSGFALKELNAKVEIAASTLQITESDIRTDRSRVALNRLEYRWNPGQYDWRNFITRMQQYYKLGPSSVSFVDLAYFNERLRGIKNTVRCTGIVSNTVHRLEGRDLLIEFGNKSVLRGNFKSSGLPNFRKTLFEINFRNSQLNPEDLETIYLPWLGSAIPVPAPLHHFSHFDVEGKFRGTIEDFILDVKSATQGMRGNIQLVYTPCPESRDSSCTALSGEFDFPAVDFGKLSGVNTAWVGWGNMSGKYHGTLYSTGTNMNATAQIHRLNVNRGNLKDIDLSLTYENNKLNLESSVCNEGVDAGITVNYDNTGDTVARWITQGHFSVENLNRFGWSVTNRDENMNARFDVLYAEKSKDENFTRVTISDLSYSTPTDSFAIQANMENRMEGGHYTTSILSDVIDLQLEGHYVSARPWDFPWILLRTYLPAYPRKGTPKRKEGKEKKVDFRYTVDMKNMNRVLKVLCPDAYIADGTHIYSDYDNLRNEFHLLLSTDSLRYGDWETRHSKIEMKGDKERLSMVWKADELNYMEWSRIYNMRNEIALTNNKVHTRFLWSNWQNQTYCGALAADAELYSLPDDQYGAEIKIHPGVIVMSDSTWQISASSVTLKGRELTVNDFLLKGGEQSFSVNGRISENPSDSLAICLNRFNLTEFNRLVLGNGTHIFGMIDGKMVVQDYYKDKLLYSDIRIRDWGLNKDTLGSLQLTSFWDVDSNRMVIQAENRVREDIPLQVYGYYTPASDSIDIKVRLTQLGLGRIGKYANEYFTSSAGNLNGEIRVTGTSGNPDVSGYLGLDSATLYLRKLHTGFTINDSVLIDRNRIYLKNLVIADAEKNLSVCSGYYSLSDNLYDLNITFRNFLLMNTGREYRDIVYGRIYLSGFTHINSKDGLANVTINARPESNSELYLPLTSSMSEEDGNFLHFVNRSRQQQQRTVKVKNEKSNLLLNANLELNDNLKVQIVFDPTIGDILKATGNGNLKFNLDRDGKINILGEYNIAKGDYLFTLGGVFNKHFQLRRGGSIKWNGSPYDATVDLNAVYNLKTSLNELLASTNSLSERSMKVPVECILNLSNNITNPLVKFDINFPSLDNQTKSFIQSLFSSQDEINKQMFSLLMLNKFYKSDYTDISEAEDRNIGYLAGVTTATEMASRQFSQWISKISNNIDVDFSYRPGDNTTSNEIGLALSTQLLNDRVTLTADGNMDVGNTKNATPNSTNNNNIAGDFDMDVKLNQQGSLKLKAYSHTNEKIIYKNNTEAVQGVGISYQETFDTFKELVHRYFGLFKKQKE